MPIGAHLPEWFMKPQHWSPKEAVHVHNDLNCKQSVAVHFGTFQLADDSYNDAPNELLQTLDMLNIHRSKFIIPLHGHTNRIKLHNDNTT